MGAGLKGNIFYRSFYKRLKKEWPDRAGEIWKASADLCGRLLKEYKSEEYYIRYLICPAVALYKTMAGYNEKKGLYLFKTHGQDSGKKIRKIIRFFTSFPGVSYFLWKDIYKIFESSSSEDKGYKRKNLSCDGKTATIDITECPLCSFAEKLGAKQACQTVCEMDKIYMTGFKGTIYTRTKSLAAGDDCCDYLLTKE